MLQSQLYGRARDIVKKVDSSIIHSAKRADAVVSAIYKRDPLDVISEVYLGFIDMLRTKRGADELCLQL